MKRVASSTNLATSYPHACEQEERVFIHPSAVVDPSVRLGQGAQIHANAVIERGVQIGEKAVILSGCYIGEECSIGAQTVLYPQVVLREKTVVGNKVIIESGVVIGSDGFGYAKEKNGVNCKVPQVGRVTIEDEVLIGANSTIDRATLGRTVIGKGSRIGNLVQVGHNAVVGEETQIGDSVGVCGSCKIGNSVAVGHGAGLVGHIRIGDGSNIENGAGVSKDVRDGARMIGSPAMEEDGYKTFQQYLERLPELLARISALEKKCAP